MQMRQTKRTLSCLRGKSLFGPLALIVAIALFTTGCNGGVDGEASSGETVESVSRSGGAVGEGSREFAFTTVDKEGNETEFEIHTDKETVGEALEELGLIEGEESEFGLYVKIVNGITVDYDKDGKYWAFYVNGEYAPLGVDSTPIAEGETYSFRVE